MFLPQESAYQDHYGDYVTANVDKAKSIMEAAGWKLGSDGVYAIGDKKAEFRLGHKVIDTREKVAQLVNASCAKAGIKVDDDQDEDFNAKRLPASDFDTALFAWVGTPFKSGSYGIYTTGGGGNYNKYSNKEVDKLFKQSNSELDEAKRNDLLNQIDQLIAKDHASMPTYQFSDMVAQSSSITPTLTYVGPSGGALWNAQEWVYKQ
jgi:peptide/nickel transport system substrate-binding protein